MKRNLKLEEYITKAKYKDLPKSQIKKDLEKFGYSEDYINDYFSNFYLETNESNHSPKSDFGLSSTNQKPEMDIIEVTLFNRRIPDFISYLLIFILISIIVILAFAFQTKQQNSYVINGYSDNVNFISGVSNSVEDIEFLKKMKTDFLSSKKAFLEADLDNMKIRYYEDGLLVKEADISHKGKEGSWWETPTGLYNINYKIKNHFSSFGQVYMPYSLQFQGNFFIHGPTSYPDGTLTSSDYSGGCIRVNLDDMKEIYELVEKDTPLIVIDENSDRASRVQYEINTNLADNVSYLVADLENGFLFADNLLKEERSIASITKLMTALIVVEYINVEKEVTISDYMLVDTSIPRLISGQKIKVLDLLSLLLLESSNEAAMAFYNLIDKNTFIDLMNQKAAAIGMGSTSFADTSGVLAGNISNSEDLYKLAKYLYHNRSFILHMTMGTENRVAYGNSVYSDLQNLNEIEDLDLIGGKTGVSTSAKDSMMAVLNLPMDGQDRPVVVIVLGSDNAKRDIGMLIDSVSKAYTIKD